MPSVLPVHAISRGASIRWMVEVIVPGPAFQRKVEPSARSPCIATDLTEGFQLGQRSIDVRTSHTTSGGAVISISLAPRTGACGRPLKPEPSTATAGARLDNGGRTPTGVLQMVAG